MAGYKSTPASASADAVTLADVGSAAPAGSTFGFDEATGDLFYVDDSGDWAKVLYPIRESVIDSDSYDSATATAAGDHPATVLSLPTGSLVAAWVTADGSGLTTASTVNVLVDGVSVGTAVIPVGGVAPVAVTLNTSPTALTAAQLGSFSLVGNGAGPITDIAVTFQVMS